MLFGALELPGNVVTLGPAEGSSELGVITAFEIDRLSGRCSTVWRSSSKNCEKSVFFLRRLSLVGAAETGTSCEKVEAAIEFALDVALIGAALDTT